MRSIGFLLLFSSLKNDIKDERSKRMEPLKRSDRNKQPEAKQEDLYNNALELMANDKYSDYEFASLIFDSIKGYKESDVLYMQCKEKIKEFRYEQAKALIGKNTIQDLEKAQSILKEFDPEDPLAKESKATLVSLYYQEGQDQFNNKEYEQALKLFHMIPNYEDASDYIEQCEQEIQKMIKQTQKKGKNPIGKILVALVLICVVAVGGWFGYSYFATPYMALDVVTVEYGEEVKLTPELFVSKDSKNINISSLELVSDLTNDEEKYTYDLSTRVVVSKGKEYLDVGSYEVEIRSKDGKFSSSTFLEVKDTKAPTITCSQEKFEYEIGQAAIDFASTITIEDKSEVTVEIDTSAIDWNTAGTYKVKVKAQDAYKNESEKIMDVVVKEAAYVEQPVEEVEEVQPSYQQNTTYYYYVPETTQEQVQPSQPSQPSQPEPELEPIPEPVPDVTSETPDPTPDVA